MVDFQDTCSPFPLREDDNRAPGDPSRTTATQVSKINTTLRQCMRDWSDEGERERSSSYAAVISELERLRPVKPEANEPQKVIVPGAGAGRLAYEIVSRGYGCAGTQSTSFRVELYRNSELVALTMEDVSRCHTLLHTSTPASSRVREA